MLDPPLVFVSLICLLLTMVTDDTVVSFKKKSYKKDRKGKWKKEIEKMKKKMKDML